MITDDLRKLADRAARVEGRPDERLDEVHGRIRATRRRRAVTGAAGVAALVTAMVVGGLTFTGSGQHSAGPIDKPSPTIAPSPSHTERPHGTFHPAKGIERLTPRQTVQSYNAQLVAAAVSLDDPDIRVSLWSTTCQVCPKPFTESRFRPTFNAVAVTDDAFRTARYVRGPGLAILDSISSVSPDTFLFNDRSNGVLKLLGTDGVLRRVRMVDESRAPDNPRLVVPCGGFDGGLGVGWCVLDPTTATAARLGATFAESGYSAGNPALEQRPWGSESTAAPPYRAWWDQGGVRGYADLPLSDVQIWRPVPSLTRGEDAPTFVRWRKWSHRLDVFRVDDRSGVLSKVASRPWLGLTRAEIGERGHPNEIGLDVEYARMPDGALLAWSSREFTRRPGLTIWRSRSLTSGEFEPVYAAPTSFAPVSYEPDLVIHEGRIHLGTLVSDDDGRTWTEPVTTWR